MVKWLFNILLNYKDYSGQLHNNSANTLIMKMIVLKKT